MSDLYVNFSRIFTSLFLTRPLLLSLSRIWDPGVGRSAAILKWSVQHVYRRQEPLSEECSQGSPGLAQDS